MIFGEPHWLFGLLLLPIFIALCIRNDGRTRERLQKLIAARLLPALTDSVSVKLRILRRLFFLAALGCIFVALARPQWGFLQKDFTRRGRDFILAIDTSKSMMTADVAPNRLARAKLAAQDVLNAMKGDRFGLVAFAGTAQVQAPLTIDYQTIVESISQLDTKTVDRGGTDITSAIQAAELALGKSVDTHRAVVLFTDGEDLEDDAVTAAKQLKGIRVFTVGIGTAEGANIPVAPGSNQYLRDRHGEVVKSRLDEKRLQEIARQTGGFYVHLDGTSMSRLVQDGLKKLGESNIDQRSAQVPIERYRWPLALGLALFFASLLIGDRRNISQEAKTVTAIVALWLGLAVRLPAMNGAEQYRQGDYEGSLQTFREELKKNPDSPVANFNTGNAAYRLHKYDDAFESYSKAMLSNDMNIREQAYYNGGNALFMEGDESQDIEQQLTNYYDARYQYQQALNLNPQDQQARKNLSLLEERIKQAEKEKQEQESEQKQRQQKRPRQKRNRQQRPQDQKKDQQRSKGDQQQGEGSGDDQSQESPDPSDPENNQPEQGPTPDKKKQGDLREMTPSEQERQRAQAQPTPGQMSEDEALGLLDSLRSEGDRVDLMHHRNDRRVLRDW
jgi:Ca-activated chloride channel family protein